MSLPRRFKVLAFVVALVLGAALFSIYSIRAPAELHAGVRKAKGFSFAKPANDQSNQAALQESEPEAAAIEAEGSAPKPNSEYEGDSDFADDGSYGGYDGSYEGDDEEDFDAPPGPYNGDYRELYSLTTNDRKFIPVFLGGDDGYNLNIIPHPTKHDMWILVLQHEQSREDIAVSGELTCVAGLLDGVFVCEEAPTILPISPSIEGNCPGDLALYNFRSGPRDARMFYGPDGPYILYGSQSQYACLGIWLQDVRMLLDAFHIERVAVAKLFSSTTEVQRPEPWHGIEKNFFLFWDLNGKTYVHHDIYPKRVFSGLDFDGSVSEDIAPKTANEDEACMAKYMPHVGVEYESIHQATNSLSITLCERSDPKCKPDASNTYIMHIFQHKTYYEFHGIYEPYLILFQQEAPFAVKAIAQRPFWIHGRAALTGATGSLQYYGRPESDLPANHTEMFYVTSMSWKAHDQKYHGYLDDVVFLAFGIEDTRAGAIDIKAADLVQDLAFC